MAEGRRLGEPASVWLDGGATPGERGEPVAVALLAAGHLALARSPKFHRPRGPWCLRGACDGCLARVNDIPNVMTCRVPAEEGMHIETQNVAGSRETDLLRVTDWFFPHGMDHHELLAGGAGRFLPPRRGPPGAGGGGAGRGGRKAARGARGRGPGGPPEGGGPRRRRAPPVGRRPGGRMWTGGDERGAGPRGARQEGRG